MATPKENNGHSSTNDNNDLSEKGLDPHFLDHYLKDLMGLSLSGGENGSSNGSKFHDIHLEDYAKEDLSDGSNGKYRRQPAGYENPIWQLGWTDGRYGQPNEDNEDIIRYRAKLSWLKKIEQKEKEITEKRITVQDLRGSLNRLQERFSKIQEHYYQLWEERADNYKEYSYFLSFTYLFVALCIFISDVPLSLKLVAHGFALRTEILDKSQKPILRIDDLFTNPINVATQLWEPLLLAFGIALAGVFIKFFLDEVIFNYKTKESKPLKVRVALSIILGLFVVTIILLGFFRADTQKRILESEFNKRQQTIQQLLGTQATATQPLGESPWVLPTFIGLTLMLPLIGGVCFSAGWSRLKKARQFSNAKRDLLEVEERHNSVLQRFNEAQENLNTEEELLDREKLERNWEDPLAELAINLYRHGYSRGKNVPETLNPVDGLYVRCEQTLTKLMAKKIRSKLWQGL
jgi:hypothetical protein